MVELFVVLVKFLFAVGTLFIVFTAISLLLTIAEKIGSRFSKERIYDTKDKMDGLY